MYTLEQLRQFVDLVVEVTDPDRVILFGSYAYGDPTDQSDIDLLVLRNGKEFSFEDEAQLDYQIYKISRQRNLFVRYDIFFQTEEQVIRAAKNGGAFVDALKKGVEVYSATDISANIYVKEEAWKAYEARMREAGVDLEFLKRTLKIQEDFEAAEERI